MIGCIKKSGIYMSGWILKLDRVLLMSGWHPWCVIFTPGAFFFFLRKEEGKKDAPCNEYVIVRIFFKYVIVRISLFFFVNLINGVSIIIGANLIKFVGLSNEYGKGHLLKIVFKILNMFSKFIYCFFKIKNELNIFSLFLRKKKKI